MTRRVGRGPLGLTGTPGRGGRTGHRADARLFTGPRGGRITTATLGFEHLRRHALHHTRLTWMADAGVPVHVLRKIAGHGSLTTTQRYLHPDAASSPAAGDSLTAFLRVPRSPSGPNLPL